MGSAALSAVRGGPEELVKRLLEGEDANSKRQLQNMAGDRSRRPKNRRMKGVGVTSGCQSIIKPIFFFFLLTPGENFGNNSKTHRPILCDCPIANKRVFIIIWSPTLP